MIQHISIAAREPLATARQLAKFWRTQVLPFPMYENSFVVFLTQNSGSCIEVYPGGTLRLDEQQILPQLQRDDMALGGAFHAAISVPLEIGEVIEICDQAGWECRVEDRGGFFSVIEVWVENHTLFELLTPAMSAAYKQFATIENWKSVFGEIH